MKSKKVLALIVTALIASTVVSGCKKNTQPSENTSADQNTPIEFSIAMFGSDDAGDWSQTPVGKELAKRTGVTLKMEYLSGNDEETKAGIMVASGTYPDLISPHNQGKKFIEAGALQPLDDYLAKGGANLKKMYQGSMEGVKSPDGKIYSFTPFRESYEAVYNQGAFYLPMGVWKEAGYPKNVTWTQYLKLIKDYVAKNPTYNGKPTIGYTAVTDGWRLGMGVYQPVGELNGKGGKGPETDLKNGTVSNSYTSSDSWKKYLKGLNDLWNAGLVDKEMFSQNYDQYIAKISSGRVVGIFDQQWDLFGAKAALEKDQNYDRIPAGMPVLFDGVKEENYNPLSNIGTQVGVAISKNCKDKDRAFKFLDQMASDENQILIMWGIEGTDYSKKDGKLVKTEEQYKQLSDAAYQKQEGILGFNYFPRNKKGAKTADGTSYYPLDDTAYTSTQLKPYEKDFLKNYNANYFADLFAKPQADPFPTGWDALGDDPKINDVAQKAWDTGTKYISKLVMAPNGKFDELWEQWKAEESKIDIKSMDKVQNDNLKKLLKK